VPLTTGVDTFTGTSGNDTIIAQGHNVVDHLGYSSSNVYTYPAVKQVDLITLNLAGGATAPSATGEFTVTYGGVSVTTAALGGTPTLADAATAIANAMNAAAGTTVATVAGHNVVVTSPTAGLQLPDFSVLDASGHATDVDTSTRIMTWNQEAYTSTNTYPGYVYTKSEYTLNAADVINGGAGVDTLKVVTTEESNRSSTIDLRSVSISNVEKLVIDDAVRNTDNVYVNGTVNGISDITLKNTDWADVYGVKEGSALTFETGQGAGTDGSGAYFYFAPTTATSVTFNDTFMGNATATDGDGEFYHGDDGNGNTNGLSKATTITATLNALNMNVANRSGDYTEQDIYVNNTGNAGAVVTANLNMIGATSDGSGYNDAEVFIYQTGDAKVTSNIVIKDSADVWAMVDANNDSNTTAKAANNVANITLDNVSTTKGANSGFGAYGFNTVNVNVVKKSEFTGSGNWGINFDEWRSTYDDTNSQVVTINAAADLKTTSLYLDEKGSTKTVVTGSGNVDLGEYSASGNSTLSSSIVASLDASALTGKLAVKVMNDISSLKGGSGDDSITLTQALVAGHIIDGGAGVNSIKFSNTSGTQSLADYALINAALVNFQKMEFANAITLDTSKLTGTYSAFTFDDNSTVTKVTTQALTAKGDLTATAADYDSTTTPLTYGATTLNVTETGANKTLTLNASAATVNVTSSTSTAASATVDGDIKTLTVNLTNAANASTSPSGDHNASVSLTVVKGTSNNLAALTSVTLTGNGFATIDNSNATGSPANAATKLVTIDASALGGTVGFGTSKGNVTGGLTFTANTNVAETIKLGSGTDAITDSGSSYGKMDTIYGFDAVQESATAGVSTVDSLIFAGLTLDGSSANPGIEKMTVASSSTTLALAFVQAAAKSNTDSKVVQFVFDGSTYLFSDGGNGTLETGDLAIKLVGTVDLTTAFATHTA